ncbi:MAG: helix-turn-helix transcriptional regulator [Clostridia bacterium]|nr:helix-turn-helix transcriptional regulator [Clostridia bacterium]
MATDERIKFHRKQRDITQKYLGMSIDFDEKNADVRIAQYESGKRTPKEDILNKIAKVFDVSPKALDVPDIDSYEGIMHTLFTLEDLYGLQINNIDGEICLTLDKTKGHTYLSMFEMLNAWYKESSKLKFDEITKDEYDYWRYNYPRIEEERTKAKLDTVRAERAALNT